MQPTCGVCGSKDGTVAELKKAKVGTNIPPFHPNCRGCVLPYFDDEYFKEGQTRTARDESGKNYSIDDMTYGEWKEKFVVDKTAESGISGKKIERTEENTVDVDYINSKDYHNKFNGITDIDEVNEQIYSQAKAMLTHRNGTYKEDFCLINSLTGKIEGEQYKSEINDYVEYNNSVNNAIKNNDEYSLISIHNHATNNPPTGSDIVSNAIHKYKFGVVVAHDGRIYTYKAGDKPFLATTFGNRVDKYKIQGYNEYNSIIKTLNDFKAEYGIVWEELL